MAALKVFERTEIVNAMAVGWSLVCDLLGGTEDMRAAGKRHLPQWPAEEDDAYKARLAVATLFPAFGETVESLSAKPFSEPITVGEDVPASVVPLLMNIDLEGRNLHNFAHDTMLQVMGPGLCGILVEAPVRGEEVKTLAQERAAGIRPYWVLIKPEQILGWKKRKVNGVWQLVQLRIMECVEEDDGEFGSVSVDQVRVLVPGAWQTYRKAANSEEWVLHDEGKTSLAYIPFAPCYGKRTGFLTAKPPLKEVAYLNIKHWQSQSDQDTILHVARVPILTARQVGDEFELKVGASAAVDLGDGPQAELKYVEHTGAAIEAGKQSLDDLKDEMRQAGAELLVIDGVEKTATENRAEESIGMCKLQRIANSLEDSLNLALQFTAEYMGETEGGSVKLFGDYAARTMVEASAQLLLQANTGGKISDETFRAELKRRGILSADVDEEEEKQRIEEQGPALGTMNEPGNGGDGE